MKKPRTISTENTVLFVNFFVIFLRFGFVSFDSKEAVANVLRQGTIYLKGRKITVAPAVKKHVSLGYIRYFVIFGRRLTANKGI